MSYTCTFWYPSNVELSAASASVTMKSYEYGNTKTVARNQTTVRTRAGKTLVYDRGINFNQVMRLQFRSIKDLERAQLLSFLSAVQWGGNRVKLRDYRGEEYIIRITTPQLEAADTGLSVYAKEDSILWDFDLEVVDLTGTSDSYGEDATVPSALFIHLNDHDHPHNPEVEISLAIADGEKIVESLLCRDWKAALWLVVAEKNDQRYFATVGATHDGYGTTDATLVTSPTLEPISDTGGVAAKINYTVDISGAGATQVMSLKAETTENGFTIRARRFKL